MRDGGSHAALAQQQAGPRPHIARFREHDVDDDRSHVGYRGDPAPFREYRIDIRQRRRRQFGARRFTGELVHRPGVLNTLWLLGCKFERAHQRAVGSERGERKARVGARDRSSAQIDPCLVRAGRGEESFSGARDYR